MPVRELFIGAADGTRLLVAGDTVRVLASSDDTGGSFEVFEMTAPRDSGPPPHAHPWSESYSLIEGTVDVFVGDKTFSGAPGCFFQIPAGTLHTYRVTSDVAKVIIVTSPAGAADFFSDVDRETDMEKVAGIAVRHGITLPPPPAQ